MASGACLSEYLVRFNTLASRVEWGDAALRFQFYDGLPDRLKDRVALLGKPDNLRELVQVTTRHDNLYWEHQEEHKQARQQQPPQNTTRQPRSNQPPDHPNEHHLNIPPCIFPLPHFHLCPQPALTILCIARLGVVP